MYIPFCLCEPYICTLTLYVFTVYAITGKHTHTLQLLYSVVQFASRALIFPILLMGLQKRASKLFSLMLQFSNLLTFSVALLQHLIPSQLQKVTKQKFLHDSVSPKFDVVHSFNIKCPRRLTFSVSNWQWTWDASATIWDTVSLRLLISWRALAKDFSTSS